MPSIKLDIRDLLSRDSMSKEDRRVTSINIRKDQKDFLVDRGMELSPLVRRMLDAIMIDYREKKGEK